MEKEDLTEDQINELCMNMRVFDLLKKNYTMLDENPEFKETFNTYSEIIKQMFECIPDHQLDYILEEHRLQLLQIQESLAKKEKRKKKKKE